MSKHRVKRDRSHFEELMRQAMTERQKKLELAIAQRRQQLPVHILSDFAHGVSAMARNTLPALELYESGRWSLQDVKDWLNAVINEDLGYLNAVIPEVVKNYESQKTGRASLRGR